VTEGAPTFDGLVLVAAVAFLAPLLLGLAPRVRLPAVVLEIVAGIIIGPSVLGWVEIDVTIEVLALIGLALVLFFGGLELDVEALRGRIVRLALAGWVVSLAIAVAVSGLLAAAGLVDTPLLVAVVLSSTALGVLVPVLEDAGEIGTPLGQLVVAAGAIADLGAIVLLSLLFSGEGGAGSTLFLLAALVAVSVAVAAFAAGAGRSRVLAADLDRLQDTTAQIRVRGVVLLVVGLVAVAEALGLEVILAAFIAGAILSLVDRDRRMTHPALRRKLEAVGFGVFVPVFFVASGIRFDLDALLADAANVAMVPVFLAALLVTRGAPAVLYRGLLGDRRAAAGGLLQATSLPFVVAATAIGLELGLLDGAQAAALVAAGLLSVLVFPAAALALAAPSRPPDAAARP